MKRHTNNEKKQANDGDVKYFKSYALVFLMLVIALFIITMSPDYKYEPASRGTTDLKLSRIIYCSTLISLSTIL